MQLLKDGPVLNQSLTTDLFPVKCRSFKVHETKRKFSRHLCVYSVQDMRFFRLWNRVVWYVFNKVLGEKQCHQLQNKNDDHGYGDISLYFCHFSIHQPDYTASYPRGSRSERLDKINHTDIEIFCFVLKEEHKDRKTRHPHLAFTSHKKRT